MPVGADSALERGAQSVPLVPIRGRLETLPLDSLSWPDFESLQWRVLRDVEGLRNAQFYGEPGQSQKGLDLVAVAADNTGVALQSKRVKQFGPARVTAAVDAFRMTARPFKVSRFIIGVSREVRSRQAVDQITLHRAELMPVHLEVWDQRELSAKLRGAPAIVIEYFGRDVAEAFCDPFEVEIRKVPRREVVRIREALARTPEAATGAGTKVEKAAGLEDADPVAALALIEEAQADLTDAGFGGHAAKYEPRRASLLVALGRSGEATRKRLDDLWAALEVGHSVTAGIASSEISALAGQSADRASQVHIKVAEAATRLHDTPMWIAPEFADLMVGESSDRARLAALAGESALAAGDLAWLKSNAIKLRNLAAKLSDEPSDTLRTLRVRLLILAAEGSGKWAAVLGEARRLAQGHENAALVQARYARDVALRQKFEEAEASWDEAAGNACLAERWTDASRWTFSRRAFRTRWRPFTSDELLPIQTALSRNGPDPTVLASDEDALENAHTQLADDRLRPAAISAQRALRDAVTLSDWEGERRARRLLADVLARSGEHRLAANHLIRAGEVKALRRLGERQRNEFIDVIEHLTAHAWWIAGAAYQLIGTQADLAPDEAVPQVAECALGVLEAAADGRLIDLASFEGSRYLGAVFVLGELSERLDTQESERALGYFESLPTLQAGESRHHDKHEALIVAGIVRTHSSLADRAFPHLVRLLARSDSARVESAVTTVMDRFQQAESALRELADLGNSWAISAVQTRYPDAVSRATVESARSRLETPLEHIPGVFQSGVGSQSIDDSLMVRTLPVHEQLQSLSQLIERAESPYVSASDRRTYLIAASNLKSPVDRESRGSLIDRVLELVTSPPEYLADGLDFGFQHPLGAVRIGHRSDSRAEAAHLCAAMARTRAEKKEVVTATLRLIGEVDVSEYWVTRALQRLGDVASPDVGFLSGQNWALKSFAAILWSRFLEPRPVGLQLATDEDVRVRRALARYLADRNTDPRSVVDSAGAANEVLALLKSDPCFSVRRAADAGE